MTLNVDGPLNPCLNSLLQSTKSKVNRQSLLSKKLGVHHYQKTPYDYTTFMIITYALTGVNSSKHEGRMVEAMMTASELAKKQLYSIFGDVGLDQHIFHTALGRRYSDGVWMDGFGVSKDNTRWCDGLDAPRNVSQFC